MMMMIKYVRFLPTKRVREAWRLNEEIKSLITKTVVRQREVDRGEQKQQNLLQAILRSAGSDDASSFVVDNCKNIYFAGHETTAVTASWCLMLLALHPEWQARARAEAVELCGRGPLDTNSLHKTKIVSKKKRILLHLKTEFLATLFYPSYLTEINLPSDLFSFLQKKKKHSIDFCFLHIYLCFPYGFCCS